MATHFVPFAEKQPDRSIKHGVRYLCPMRGRAVRLHADGAEQAEQLARDMGTAEWFREFNASYPHA